MNDNSNDTGRYYKTLSDLTTKDVLIIGSTLLAIRFAGQVTIGVMKNFELDKKLDRFNDRIREKTEEVKAENSRKKKNL